MEPVPVFDLTDERIAPYANLKERTLRGESLFVAEGELVVERLAQSRYAMASVFADESRLQLWNKIAKQCNRQDVPVYTSSTALMKSIVGYDFSMGLMAVGVREQESDASALFNPAFRRLVCLPECVKPDNLGTVFRSSAALGMDGILLSTRSCDPLSRRALRTSMAATLKLPWGRCSDIVEPIQKLRSGFGFKLVGTVLRPDAVNLNQFVWPEKTILALGNEYAGLSDEFISLCDDLVTIPMSAGVDSLNVGVSAGIFIYALSQGGFSGRFRQ